MTGVDLFWVLFQHTNALLADLRVLHKDGDLVSPEYAVLYKEFDICCASVSDAMERHWMAHDETKLHREVITALILLTSKYDTWLASRPAIPENTRILHEYLLRHLKGMIKAARIWKIDEQVQP